MKKTIIITLAAILFFNACSGCEEKKESNKGFKPLLDREYDYVFGLAIPDSVREWPIEVFVGRVLDKVPSGDSLINGAVSDTFMSEQIRRFQNTYVAAMKYHNDAEVKIISDVQTVTLTWVGSGTYRDINNELHIEPLKTYRLEVRRPGERYYSDEVTVPGNFHISNFKSGDTVIGYPKKDIQSTEFCYTLYPIITTKATGGLLYRHQNKMNSPHVTDTGPFLYVTFKENNLGAPSLYALDTIPEYIKFNWRILSFDSSLSVFYQTESISANKDVFDFLDYWEYEAHVTKRSSIDAHGAEDVIGNFGAYNATRFDFTVKGVKDSCFCTRYPPECP